MLLFDNNGEKYLLLLIYRGLRDTKEKAQSKIQETAELQ